MSAFSNDLSKGEAERLALLLEELCEAGQAVGKILRHGYESTNPDDALAPHNREQLEKELGDVRHAIELLCQADDVQRLGVMAAAMKKSESVRPWLHHQPKYLMDAVTLRFKP